MYTFHFVVRQLNSSSWLFQVYFEGKCMSEKWLFVLLCSGISACLTYRRVTPQLHCSRGDQGTRVSITVSPAVQQLYDKFQTSDNKMWQQRSTISNNTHNSLNTSLYRVLNILKFWWKKLCLKTFRIIKLEMYVIFKEG